MRGFLQEFQKGTSLCTDYTNVEIEFAAMLPREVVGELIFAPKMAQIEVAETGTCYAENARLKAQA